MVNHIEGSNLSVAFTLDLTSELRALHVRHLRSRTIDLRKFIYKDKLS